MLMKSRVKNRKHQIWKCLNCSPCKTLSYWYITKKTSFESSDSSLPKKQVLEITEHELFWSKRILSKTVSQIFKHEWFWYKQIEFLFLNILLSYLHFSDYIWISYGFHKLKFFLENRKLQNTELVLQTLWKGLTDFVRKHWV
jgi:hypothetical protein